MTDRCFLDWCKNPPSDNVFLLSFPKNKEKLANWCRILNINIKDIEKCEKAKVCSYHFKPENVKRVGKLPKANSSQVTIQQSTEEDDNNFNKNVSNRGEESTLFESLQIELAKNAVDETADPLKIPNDLDHLDYGGDENDNAMDIGDIEYNELYDNEDTNLNEDVITISDNENTVNSFDELPITDPIRPSDKDNDNMIDKSTNTPKRLYSEEFYPEKYQEKIEKNNEIIKSLKKRLELKKEQGKLNISTLNELKKKKLENAGIITLLQTDEMKIPCQIYTNLLTDSDSMNFESMPDEFKTLTCNLYNCSKNAYDFIRETFKNAFPSPEVVEKYCSKNKNNVKKAPEDK